MGLAPPVATLLHVLFELHPPGQGENVQGVFLFSTEMKNAHEPTRVAVPKHASVKR